MAVAVLGAIVASSGLAWWANCEIIGYFEVDKRWETLSQLFIAAGGALIGATAIAFSIITFAMQVNVERMPHALFNRLSADWRLLAYAVASFGAACGVALLSLVPDVSWSALVLVAGAWLTLAVFGLYMLAYMRCPLRFAAGSSRVRSTRDGDRTDEEAIQRGTDHWVPA